MFDTETILTGLAMWGLVLMYPLFAVVLTFFTGEGVYPFTRDGAFDGRHDDAA